MSIQFRAAANAGVSPVTAAVPDGAIVGVLGGEGSGAAAVLDLAAQLAIPEQGAVERTAPVRHLAMGDTLDLAPVKTLVMRHAFCGHDAMSVARARMGIEELRRSGTSVLLWTHDQALVRALCDEVWWFDEGRLAASGDPAEVLAAYNRDVARRVAEWGRTAQVRLAPSLRRGDGRARLTSIETLDAEGRPTAVWRSGERVQVRVAVEFGAPVEDPVVGIMIRTRIGFEVFGTNTELENVKVGPVAAGGRRTVSFAFGCALCPQEYTITAASHDPDGVWHDWMEDATAVAVAAARYTAGVADLRASVEVTA
jgi:lipopolysaccharide transport system ATP-binding protein